MNRFLDALAIITLIALAVITWLIPMPARSQTPDCAPMIDALAGLAAKYQEQPRVTGLTSAGSLLIITASDGGGWSVLLVTPDGNACMAASGEGFGLVEPTPPGVEG